MLYHLAVARDFLSARHLQLLLGSGSADVENALMNMREFLHESQWKRGYFQLFHDSFRRFLQEYHSEQLNITEWKMIDFCLNLRNLKREAASIRMYPLKHAVYHLRRRGTIEDLFILLSDTDYQNQQIKETGQFLSSFETCQEALEMALMAEDEDRLLKAGTHFLHLHLRQANTIKESLTKIHHASTESLLSELEGLAGLSENKLVYCCLLLLHQELEEAGLKPDLKERVQILLDFLDGRVTKEPS